MSSWTPEEQGLQEVYIVLRDSTQTENTAVQKEMTMRLNSFNSIPEYPAYLVHIMNMPEADERLRSVAGLVLKNNAVAQFASWPPHVVEYVKQIIMSTFHDQPTMVRNSAGGVIVAILDMVGPAAWPQVLQLLLQSLDSPSIDQQLAAFSVFQKACEDYPRKFDNIEINGARPLDYMIAKFISLLEHPVSKMRHHALTSLSQFISLNTVSLSIHMDAFLAALFKRAGDDDPDVRQGVCECLVLLLGARPDKIVPVLGDVASFMLYATQDKDENVALEACEFWLTFAEEEDLKDQLRPLLGKLAPVLLNLMAYTEEDLMWLQGDDQDDKENTHVADRPEDIKPRFYGGAARGQEHDGGSNDHAGGQDQTDLEDDDYSSYDEDDLSTDWNLRKCAAAAIDVLAVRFGAELLEVILPFLKEKLWSSEWLARESAILALGAMAEGCIDALEEHLPALIPFLVQSMSDKKPLVRSIVCWTLGRYSSWCTQPNPDGTRGIMFVPAMEVLLRAVMDNNKRVQEAGCSAFATFEEDAGRQLEPFLDPILRNLVYAFERYQQKNLLILYDAVGTLADAVGDAMSAPAAVGIIMPPLMAKWANLGDEDEDIVPLLECLSSVTMACGRGFAEYAPPVFQRAVRIAHDQLYKYQAWAQSSQSQSGGQPPNSNTNNELDEPDKTFLIVALDLLSGLAQGLGPLVEPLIAQSQPPLMPLIAASLKHPQPAVRQSAYALIGDLAIGVPSVVRPAMPVLMPELINQLALGSSAASSAGATNAQGQLVGWGKSEFISACNNAAWSVGEIALHIGILDANTGARDPDFPHYIPALVERLIPILLNSSQQGANGKVVRSPKSLIENAAVTLGRLALVQPAMVAPHLEVFAMSWCQALWEIKDNSEKDSAFRGFCAMIEINPQGIQNHFIYFCNSAAKWNTPSPELEAKFRHIFGGFKDLLGPQWDGMMASMPPQIAQRLRERYGC